jgi:hypothetical protein
MFDFTALSPAAIVAVDGHSGRPLEIRAGGERLAVTALEAVRDETAAYPLETGPRTVFVVRSEQRRYRLVHLVRERRWTVEELAAPRAGLTRVA